MQSSCKSPHHPLFWSSKLSDLLNPFRVCVSLFFSLDLSLSLFLPALTYRIIEKEIESEKESEKEPLKLDLKFKEGETIKVNLNIAVSISHLDCV